MATGLFGVSWTEIIDFLLKLAPAASIVGGILAARVQLRSNRQINAVMIAKNHYREMLDAFLKSSDILYLGSNPTSFAELKKDIPRYRRYRTLFTLMSFAMQELYLAIDLKREKNWEHMIRVFISPQEFHSVARRLRPLQSTGSDAELPRILDGHCTEFRALRSADERGAVSEG